MGGMLAICDIKEYRTAAKALNCISVDLEFDTLHALCNLLVAVPENLRQVRGGFLSGYPIPRKKIPIPGIKNPRDIPKVKNPEKIPNPGDKNPGDFA